VRKGLLSSLLCPPNMDSSQPATTITKINDHVFVHSMGRADRPLLDYLHIVYFASCPMHLRDLCLGSGSILVQCYVQMEHLIAPSCLQQRGRIDSYGYGWDITYSRVIRYAGNSINEIKRRPSI
jgi:hypothetical protein